MTEECRAEREDLADQLDLAFEMQREYLARAERAEAAIERVEAFLDQAERERPVTRHVATVDEVRAALRGD